MDLNDLLAEVEGIGRDRFIPSKALKNTQAGEIIDHTAIIPDPAQLQESEQQTTQDDESSLSETIIPPVASRSSLAEHAPAGATAAPLADALDMILDVELELTVELGKARIPLKKLMSFQPGDEFALEQYPGHPLQIFANDRLVAYGEALIVDGELAVKLTELITPAKAFAE